MVHQKPSDTVNQTRSSAAASHQSASESVQEIISPKVPEASWLTTLTLPCLQNARGYKLDISSSAIKLDQNESPWDVPESLKKRVAERLLTTPWNRYPSPYSDDLLGLLAQHSGVSQGSVLVGPGSNSLLSLLLATFTKKIAALQNTSNAPELWLAQPSFPHCESQCIYEGIPYRPWALSEDLEYCPKALESLTPGSVVIFATPNNPVGNSLALSDLEMLLTTHPTTLFIADEAYYEFTDRPLTELLARFSNLILVRTFSKTMASASVRIGYILAASQYIDELRKMRAPFLLSHFQNICLEEMLRSTEMQRHVKLIVEHVSKERERLFNYFIRMQDQLQISVKKSEGNFFLLRWKDAQKALDVYNFLLQRSIQVRNVSGAPRLAGCLRLSIGTVDENSSLLRALDDFILRS